MKKFTRKILRLPPWLLTTLTVLAILWLTLAPHPLPDNDIPTFEGIDKVVHACMFGGLYFMICLDRVISAHRHSILKREVHSTAEKKHESSHPIINGATDTIVPTDGTVPADDAVTSLQLGPAWRTAFLFAIVCTAFGGVIELTQEWMNIGRGCDLWDFVADAVGVVISVLLTPPVLTHSLK